MNNKKSLALILLAFTLLLGGASMLYRKLSASQNPKPLLLSGTQSPAPEASMEETTAARVVAPDFTVYDTDGNEVHLSDYIGKPIVLNFWASWCGPCQMEMPDFHEAYLTLGDEIAFLMINITTGRETLENASAFIKKNGYTFPVFYDTTSHAAMTYGAYSLPTTYFIDAQGYAVAQAIGALDAETLQYGIDQIRP